MTASSRSLRGLPSVDRLLTTNLAARLRNTCSRAYLVETIRAELEVIRAEIRGGSAAPDADAILERVEARIAQGRIPALRRVVNATGVILHTNLGRAELATEAIEAVRSATGTVNLEYDLGRGERGDRDALVESDLCHLTGAEAATVVNNNAAAVLLALNTLAAGKEVVVSRGELIEIGGSFRIPAVLEKSGVRLREVGTTNRTHRADYEAGIGLDTGALLKVHTSNYRIVGFTAEVPLEEIVEIGRLHDIPVVEDLGSGALIDLSRYGLPKEPVVAERLALGADVVTCSGDKLLGGPQAGLILGRRAAVEAIKKNPLKRALRCDKLTLAALAATLRLYRESPDLEAHLPVLRWLVRPVAEIEAVARQALPTLRDALGEEFNLEMVTSQAQIGSGALPTETLESRAIAIAHPRLGADDIAALFRAAEPPVVGRIQDGRFLLDLRTVSQARELDVKLPGELSSSSSSSRRGQVR